LSVNGTDRIGRGRQPVSIRWPAGAGTPPRQQFDRTSACLGKTRPWKTFPWKTFPRKTFPRKTCASNMNSKPRLRQQRLALRRLLSLAHGIGATLNRQRTALLARASRAGLRLSCFSRVSASLARSAVVGAVLAPKRLESGVHAGSRFSGSHYRGRAGCPNATQLEPVTVSASFLRPIIGNWQVACGLWPARSRFRQFQRHFCRELIFD
jgi:hypothetical protein